MNISIKPSLIILCSFILGYISFFLPGTKVQYQVINESSRSTHVGFASVFGSKFGTDAFPCSLARFESPPSSQFLNLLRVWQGAGKVLTLVPIMVGISYVVRRKISPLRFFALTAVLMGAPVAIFLAFFNELSPECNSNDLYRMVTFGPYLPFLLISIVANLLGYVGTRAVTKLNTSPVTTSADNQGITL